MGSSGGGGQSPHIQVSLNISNRGQIGIPSTSRIGHSTGICGRRDEGNVSVQSKTEKMQLVVEIVITIALS